MGTIVEAQHAAEPEKAFDAITDLLAHAVGLGGWYHQLWTAGTTAVLVR